MKRDIEKLKAQISMLEAELEEAEREVTVAGALKVLDEIKQRVDRLDKCGARLVGLRLGEVLSFANTQDVVR